MQRITVLGATGTIGVNTLDVIARHPERFSVFALTGHHQVDRLAGQCRQFRPQVAVVADAAAAGELARQLSGMNVEILHGEAALVAVAASGSVDAVMSAIVGAAGLAPTMAAVRAGKQVYLANKESLVLAGELVIAAAEQAGGLGVAEHVDRNQGRLAAGGEFLPQQQYTLRVAGQGAYGELGVEFEILARFADAGRDVVEADVRTGHQAFPFKGGECWT